MPFRSRRHHRHHHHYNIIAIVENASNNILGDRIKAYATIMCIRMEEGRKILKYSVLFISSRYSNTAVENGVQYQLFNIYTFDRRWLVR